MDKELWKVFDASIKHPFLMLVCGPTQSGKTQFVLKLLENAERLINPPPNNITYIYGQETTALKYIKTNFQGQVNTVEGMPLSFSDYIDPERNNLLIFDDLLQESTSNKNLTNLFTKESHHKSASVILIMQDVFYHGTERKILLRNAQYLVLFKSPLDMSGIYAIANRMKPKRQQMFLNIFEEATKQPHGYLFIDGYQSTPLAAQLRTDIFKPYQRVFMGEQ